MHWQLFIYHLTVSSIIDLNQYVNEVETNVISQNDLQENNYASIRDIYIGNLKADIQNKLKGKGYVAEDVKLEVGNDDNYTLNKIIIYVTKEKQEKEEVSNTIETVNEVNISITNTQTDDTKPKKSSISNREKKKIKEYLSGIYELNENNIEIT